MRRVQEFELLADELDGLGEHAGSHVKGAFDEARLAPHVAGDVEAGRLAFAERPPHLKALDRRGRDHGVRAVSLYPGRILTRLARHLTPAEIAGFDALDEDSRPRIDPSRGVKTLAQGAATGVYREDCDIATIHTGEIGRQGLASLSRAGTAYSPAPLHWRRGCCR